MDENILVGGGVTVSPTLVRIVDQTYSTPNITSVRVKHPRLGDQLGCSVLCGLAFLACLPSSSYVWAFVFVVLALVPYTQRSELFIATAGSERVAFKASRARCAEVSEAIVRAMQLAAKR